MAEGSMNLTEQAVVVTGAGSGMGKATACRLVRRNALVAALDIVAEPVLSLTQELGGLSIVRGSPRHNGYLAVKAPMIWISFKR